MINGQASQIQELCLQVRIRCERQRHCSVKRTESQGDRSPVYRKQVRIPQQYLLNLNVLLTESGRKTKANSAILFATPRQRDVPYLSVLCSRWRRRRGGRGGCGGRAVLLPRRSRPVARTPPRATPSAKAMRKLKKDVDSRTRRSGEENRQGRGVNGRESLFGPRFSSLSRTRVELHSRDELVLQNCGQLGVVFDTFLQFHLVQHCVVTQWKRNLLGFTEESFAIRSKRARHQQRHTIFSVTSRFSGNLPLKNVIDVRHFHAAKHSQ